jgi:hypothetical protein
VWPQWQRILFRFFAVYLLLQIAPWNWFRAIPGVPFVLRYYFIGVNKVVTAANANVFHVRETLVPVNGSGDTSWAWTQLWLYLTIAAIACVVWTIADRKRTSYTRALYWLRLIVRYYIASAALSYGIIKLFLLQMPFPAISQLATPLGDLLPMRLSWLFIGYSTPYQIFSGAMETVAGLLLLNRRTVTAGLFAATGAFLNVVMINLSYDVPVKLYSSHLLFSCLFLLALDSPRLLRFLVLNKPISGTTAYDPIFARPWQFWGSVAGQGIHRLSNSHIPAQESVGALSGREATASGRSVRRRRVRRAAVRCEPRHCPSSTVRHLALARRDLRQQQRRKRRHERPALLAALPARLLPVQAEPPSTKRLPYGRRRLSYAIVRSCFRCDMRCLIQIRFGFTRRSAATRFTSSSRASRDTSS